MADTEDYSEEATPTAHHESHEDEGADEISLEGLAGEPAELATHAGLPTVHQDAPDLISTHKGDAAAHHAKFTVTEHDAVARHPLANLDPLVCSEAEAGVLIGLHTDDTEAHHDIYTDPNARAAISNIFGADGKADSNIDLDGHDIAGGTVDGVQVGEIGNELILQIVDDCGDTSNIANWVITYDALAPVDNQVYVKQGSHSMALEIDASKNPNDYGYWLSNQSQGDWTSYQHDWLYLWVYIPTLDYFRPTGPAFLVSLGTDGLNRDYYAWTKAELTVGWNLFKADFDNPAGHVGTIDWSDISYLRLMNYEVTDNVNDFTIYADSIMLVRLTAQNHLVSLNHKGDTLFPARLLVSDSMEFGTTIATGDVVITGYITIKDAAGNDRKLAIID